MQCNVFNVSVSVCNSSVNSSVSFIYVYHGSYVPLIVNDLHLDSVCVCVSQFFQC